MSKRRQTRSLGPFVGNGHHGEPTLERLRVLAFCDYFHPEVGGGAERVAFEVYRRLSAWGAGVTVVSTAGSIDRWRDELAGLRVIQVPSVDLTRRLGLQASLTRGATCEALRIAHEMRPDLLHANSLQFQTSIAAARVQHRLGLPMVLTAHIGGFERLPQPWRAVARLHESTIGRYVLGRCHRVIAVSDAVASHIRRYREVAGRIRVVPNGVDHTVFRPRETPRPLSPAVSLVFVGRLVPNKGPGLLLEALASLRQESLPVHLTVVGGGPMRGRLERRVAELGIADAVDFAGPSDDVAAHLQAADVFVRPTLTEGMPLAVLEAMASGACVVASDVPGNASLVRHGESGLLFPAGDARGLAEALRRVVLDGAERVRLSAQGHAASLEYSWDRCARETLEVLLEAVAAAPTRRAA